MSTEPETLTDAVPRLWDAGGHAALEIDPTIYPVTVALAAGYKFTDRAFVWLESAPANRYCVFLRPKMPASDLATLAGAFANELVDQAIRYRLEQEFAGIRAIVTAQAFAEGNLLDAVSVTNPQRVNPDDRSQAG